MHEKGLGEYEVFWSRGLGVLWRGLCWRLLGRLQIRMPRENIWKINATDGVLKIRWNERSAGSHKGRDVFFFSAKTLKYAHTQIWFLRSDIWFFFKFNSFLVLKKANCTIEQQKRKDHAKRDRILVSKVDIKRNFEEKWVLTMAWNWVGAMLTTSKKAQRPL